MGKINMIADSISKSFNKGVYADYKLLINSCCSEWGISVRTAKEYIDVALVRLDSIIIVDKNKDEIITPKGQLETWDISKQNKKLIPEVQKEMEDIFESKIDKNETNNKEKNQNAD